MKLEAIKQAGERLDRAERAFEELKAADNYGDAEQAWSDFLLAANSFFSKLEQGAKGNGKSDAWFGRKVNQRRTDPTLRYIRAARHSDEHGIERVTERHDAGWNMPFGQQRPTELQFIHPETGAPKGDPIKGFLYGKRIIAITAHDRRFDDVFEPPVGQIEGEGSFPPDIANDALAKLRIIFEEAAAFV